jgi:hypothetical protein
MAERMVELMVVSWVEQKAVQMDVMWVEMRAALWAAQMAER